MSGPLLLPVCTFRRVFETVPLNEVLTLPELIAALRRFEIKQETAAKIEREVARIRQASARLLAGEAPRGKFMGKLAKAAEKAKKEGRDPAAAVAQLAAALEDDARRGAKRDLRLWSPALYRPGADKRGSENVTHVSCLVLDYDDGTSISDASDRFRAFFHLVHTTWSHTPEHPKFRLVMPLAFSVAAEDWPKVWSWAEEIARFEIDPAMKSPAATYALPAVPHRAWPREAFSRPGAILDPVVEGILERRSALALAPKRPPEGVPSVIRGEDPEHEYLDHEDPEAVYFVDEEWSEEEDWEPAPELVAAVTRSREAVRDESQGALTRTAARAEENVEGASATSQETLTSIDAREPTVEETAHARVMSSATPARDAVVVDACAASDVAADARATSATASGVSAVVDAREASGAAAEARVTSTPAHAASAIAIDRDLVERLERALARLEELSSPASVASALERLVALHRDGWLSAEELADAKRRVLAEPAPELGELRRVGPGRHRRTLAVDFDGVIHAYGSGWQGATVIGDPPVPGAIEWLVAAVERFDVAISSVRASQPGAIDAMRGWLRAHGLPDHVLERIRFPLTKPAAELYIDDRAYRFEGTFPSFDELAALEPWTRARR